MKRLPVLVWVGYVWLIGMTLFLGGVAWKRYSLRSDLDATVNGTVIEVWRSDKDARKAAIVVGFQVDGHIYTVSGSAEDVGLDAREGLEKRWVPVRYHRAAPSRASLTPGAGYEKVSAIAGALVLATLVATYRLLLWRRGRSLIPEASVVRES